MGQFISAKYNEKPNDHNGLVLYYHPFNYYSQKVLFVLNEKNIPCTLQEIDVNNGEQYSNWFIQMSPKIDVPVLQNETFIVPSSNQIINYLEVNFTNDHHAALLPTDNIGIRKKVVQFHRKICQLPIGIISVGSILHPYIVSDAKLPFVGPLRDGILQSEHSMLNKMEEYAEQNPLQRDTLLMRVKMQRIKYESIANIEEFQKLIDAVTDLLTEIENELQIQFDQSNEWLCSNELTIADISLGMFLHRLSLLGLENHFWANGSRPFLSKYYRRIKSRETFQQSLPKMKSTITFAWSKLPHTYKITTICLTSVIVGYIIFKM